HALRPAGEQLGGVSLLDVLRQDKHSHVWPRAAHDQRGPQPFVGEGRRHAHIHYDHVGLMLADLPEKLFRLSGCRYDVVACLGEQPGQALAQQDRILGNHDAHGSSTSTSVGPPAGLRTSSVPSTPATRAARPDSPCPDGSAPPIPSSRITSVSVSPDRRTVTSAWLAFACFATLVSASATTK